MSKLSRLVLLGGLTLAVRGAWADAPTEPSLMGVDKISSGDTAWMLTSTALVLMMSVPGLALFYGGMVRKKNVLATLMQTFAITCVVTLLWWLIGYSWAFTPGSRFLGGASRAFFNGMAFMHDSNQAVGVAPGFDHPRNRVCDVSTDVCGHHAGTDRRRVRRPHEVFRHAGVHVGLVAAGVCTDRPHGVGAERLAQQAGRPRLCRRHGGAHQCRHRGSCQLLGARQALGLWQRGDGAPQPHPDADRRLAVVGRLVRLQRRFGGCRRRPRRHGDAGDANGHRDGSARLDVLPNGSAAASPACWVSRRARWRAWSPSRRRPASWARLPR